MNNQLLVLVRDLPSDFLRRYCLCPRRQKLKHRAVIVSTSFVSGAIEIPLPSWNLVEIRGKVLGVEHAIKYFSFWDVPRTFAFERGGKVYVLTPEFDDELDEYPDNYDVFVVPGIRSRSVVSDWKSIEPLPKTALERIPVASVRFDKSLRKYVDGSFLDTIRQPKTK